MLSVDFALLKDLQSTIVTAPVSDPPHIVEIGSMTYFSAETLLYGRELWKSDGTEEGTVRVKDIWAGSGRSNPRFLTAVGETLFFTAKDGESGEELWMSDGTEEGTVLIKDFTEDSGGSDPSFVTEAAGKLYVAATTEEFGGELWVADLGPPPLPGDMDLDGDVDWDDVDDFVLGLKDASADESIHGRLSGRSESHELQAIGRQAPLAIPQLGSS